MMVDIEELSGSDYMPVHLPARLVPSHHSPSAALMSNHAHDGAIRNKEKAMHPSAERDL